MMLLQRLPWMDWPRVKHFRALPNGRILCSSFGGIGVSGRSWNANNMLTHHPIISTLHIVNTKEYNSQRRKGIETVGLSRFISLDWIAVVDHKTTQ